jgi:O-antigen ligase
VIGVTALRRREVTWGLAAAVITVGLLVTATSLGDGWHARADVTADAERRDSDRGDRAAEALRLVERSPLTGVGPGRYVLAVAEAEEGFPLPAHNVVLHEAAESGVLAGALTVALLLAVGWRAWRSGAEALVVFLPWVPFLLLDTYTYTFADGLALTGVWLGLLHHASRYSSAYLKR